MAKTSLYIDDRGFAVITTKNEFTAFIEAACLKKVIILQYGDFHTFECGFPLRDCHWVTHLEISAGFPVKDHGDEWFDGISDMANLVSLEIYGNTTLERVPREIFQIKSLRNLNLSGMKHVKAISSEDFAEIQFHGLKLEKFRIPARCERVADEIGDCLGGARVLDLKNADVSPGALKSVVVKCFQRFGEKTKIQCKYNKGPHMRGHINIFEFMLKLHKMAAQSK